MDLATLLGLVSGFGVIIGAIAVGGSLMLFLNAPAVIIVVGGTTAATLIKFPLRTFLGAFTVAMRAFRSKADDPNTLIREALKLSQVARKSGLLALENQKIGNPFLKQGIQLAVDGNPPEFVRKALNQDIDLAIERHETGQHIFRAIGESAPAMGMIGTLIGLVQMLSNMDDPKQIGPAMAVALLTTLYGAIIANAFALPIAEKLSLRSKEERLNKSLIIETITAIQEGLNPRVMETLLKTYLPDGKRAIATARKKAA